MSRQTYRVDYVTDDDDQTVHVIDAGDNRGLALKRARDLSKVHGTAYAIATLDGVNIGQRVYHNGTFSNQDDGF